MNTCTETKRYSYYDNEFGFKLKEEYVLDNNQDNTIEIGVTCGYDLKKIESVNFDTGEVVIGEESFNEYKDEINDYLSRRGIDNQFSVSITREGTQEIGGSSGPIAADNRWVNEDGSLKIGCY